MQLTGYSRALWQLWIVQMTYIALSCLNMTSYLQLTIVNLNASCLLPIDDGSFKCIQRCSWRAVPGCHDSSEWFTRYSLMMYCFNMTSHSQLTIANSGSSFLPPLDNGSSQWLQRCGWRAVPGRHDSSKWFKRHTLTLSWLDMTCHSQLTIANSCTSCLLPISDGSF